MEVCVSGCTQFEDSITWEWSIGWDQHWAFSILYSASEWFCTTATECRDFKVLHLTGRCYNHRTTATIEIELSDILQTPHLSHVKCSLLVICWLHSRVFIVQCQQLVLTSFKCELPFHGLPATGLRQLQSEIWTKLPSSFFKRRESTMWYVEWVSPQEHKSESVRRRPFLQSPQWPCAVWNQFSRDHCCRERSKPSCRIVGSATKWKLMTDIQLSPQESLISVTLYCHSGFPYVRRSGGRWRISVWIVQLLWAGILSIVCWLQPSFEGYVAQY